jgi:hypothetical protein
VVKEFNAKNKLLTTDLQIAESQRKQAEMVIAELDVNGSSTVHFEISVLREKKALEVLPTKLGSEISIYRTEAEEIKGLGYNRAYVIAFKNGEKISIERALETAER